TGNDRPSRSGPRSLNEAAPTTTRRRDGRRATSSSSSWRPSYRRRRAGWARMTSSSMNRRAGTSPVRCGRTSTVHGRRSTDVRHAAASTVGKFIGLDSCDEGPSTIMGHVDLAGISYALADGRPLLDRVGFRVGEGAKVALIGPNGTGKTTL